mmetsp:Transcript_33174/g.45954  ORF Transcript_33174/g.45954 Transcript_33174/m.45954 type:complete len:357 (-) Transcript_33174:251-1321(-)
MDKDEKVETTEDVEGKADLLEEKLEDYGVLRLVDLAGSERNYETVQMTAQQHRESAEINSALLALKNCFRAHALGQRTPFRSSRLTQVLRACFTEPTHKTVAVATVSPAPTDLTHTLNTLLHMSYMAAPLSNLAISFTIDLPITTTHLAKSINRWSHEEVVDWLASVQRGRFSHVALPLGLDGKGLMQLSTLRLSQLFQGTLRQARVAGEGSAWTETTEEEYNPSPSSSSVATNNIGKAIFAALREESKRIAQVEGERRWPKSKGDAATSSTEERRVENEVNNRNENISPNTTMTDFQVVEDATATLRGGLAQRVRTVGGDQVIWWLDSESPEGAAEAAEEATGILNAQLANQLNI